MSIDWSTVLSTLLVSGIGGGAVAFVARALGNHLLNLNLESHRIQLEADASRQLEHLRADLQVNAEEHAARYSRLVERQADVIAGVYARLETLHLAFRRWAALLKPANTSMTTEGERTSAAFREFADYYYPNAIWLDRSTCDLINAVVERFNSAFVDLTLDLDERGFPKDRQAFQGAYDEVTKHIPAARQQLEARLRGILRVSSEGDAHDLPR